MGRQVYRMERDRARFKEVVRGRIREDLLHRKSLVKSYNQARVAALNAQSTADEQMRALREAVANFS